MKPLSRRDRVLVVVWVAAVVVLAVVVGLVLPMRGRWVRLNDDVLRLQQQIAKAAAMYRQTPEMRIEVEQLRETAQALSRPDSDIGPVMIRQVDQLAKAMAVRLLSIRPGEPETLEGCTKHTAVFEVEGDFEGVARMLYDLERPPLQLWVEGVVIGSDRTAESAVRATVSVAVYTLRSGSEKRNAKG